MMNEEVKPTSQFNIRCSVLDIPLLRRDSSASRNDEEAAGSTFIIPYSLFDIHQIVLDLFRKE